MACTVLILNGPNLNLLGQREPDIYGHETLAEIEMRCHDKAERLKVAIAFRQSNEEGTLVSWIQEARDGVDAIVLNAGAYTHTSIAILDALKAYPGLKIELHLSNPAAREGFRRRSYVALAADGVIAGFGALGYELALEAVAAHLADRAGQSA